MFFFLGVSSGLSVSGPRGTNLSGLGDGVFHNSSHVGDGEIDVLLPVVLLDTTVVVVVHTFVRVICKRPFNII